MESVELRKCLPADPGDLYAQSVVRDVLKALEIHLSKLLGQSFLFRRPTLEACLDAAEIGPGAPILEIGPGMGHLTVAMLERGCRVAAVELDHRFAALMSLMPEIYEDRWEGRLSVIQGDALRLDWPSIQGKLEELGSVSGEIRVVSNLPYRTTVPILMRLLEGPLPIASLHVLVQAEVAARFASQPRRKDYGRVSVMMQSLCEVRTLRKVSAANFFPKPRVNSAWVQLTPHVELDMDFVFTHVKPLLGAAFSNRRKQLKRLAVHWVPPGSASPRPDAIRFALGDSWERRPEELDIAQWHEVARRLAEALSSPERSSEDPIEGGKL